MHTTIHCGTLCTGWLFIIVSYILVVHHYLILWRVVELRVVSLGVTIVEEVVVYQVPAPALVVGAQQWYVTMALVGGLLGGDAHNSHGAQGTLPDDLPGMTTAAEPAATAGAICALEK